MSSPDSVTFVGHATVLVEIEGCRLLTDPLLRGHLGPLLRQGPAPSHQVAESLDAVLISHLHHDHADLASLRKIGRGARMLVPPGSRRFFAHHGFANAAELAPGQTARVGALSVTATEAVHRGGRRLFAPRARAIGFLIEGRKRVYFAGDTGLFEGMRGLGSPLDLALLPVWGWGPSVGAGHLDPESAAEAVVLLSPRLAVPVHWGTLYPLGLRHLHGAPLRRPGPRFAARAAVLAPQVEARVLSPGESISLA